MDHSGEFLNLVNDAKTRIEEISTTQVMEKIQAGDPFFLIDIREDFEWEEGRIRGATHIGRGILERDIKQIIPDKNAFIVLYCGGGYRTALSADNLQRMGYKRVYSMAGGWHEWEERGFPTER